MNLIPAACPAAQGRHRRCLREAALLLCLFLLGALACGRRGEEDSRRGRPGSPQEPQSGGTLRVPIAVDPASMNPLLGRRGRPIDLWGCFYPSLLICVPQGARPPEVRGDLARRWDWSAETRTLTLVLQRDRYWEDTTRVSMPDVLRSYEAYRAMGWIPSGTAPDSVPDPGLIAVEAVDDSTLRMRFRPGFPFWRAAPAATWRVLPAQKLGGIQPLILESSVLAREPLSAGPFRLLDWRPGLNLWLGPNPMAPAGRRPWLQRVAFEPCPGADSRILRLALGQADLVTDVPVYRLGSLLEGTTTLRLQTEGIASVEMIFWNLSHPGNAPVLRQAVSLSVDRDRLVDALLSWQGERFGSPAGGLLDPEGPPRADSILLAAPWPICDRVAAEHLLDTAGWSERDSDGMRLREGIPLRIGILYDRSNELRERMVSLLEEDLARVGIRLDPEPLDGGSVWRRFRSGVFQTVLLGFRPPLTPDLSPLWASWGSWNGGGYSSAEVDSLVLAQYAAESGEEVERLGRLIEARVRLDQPVTFLICREAADLLSDRVRGFRATPWDPFGELAGTWLTDTTAVPAQVSSKPR